MDYGHREEHKLIGAVTLSTVDRSNKCCNVIIYPWCGRTMDDLPRKLLQMWSHVFNGSGMQ